MVCAFYRADKGYYYNLPTLEQLGMLPWCFMTPKPIVFLSVIAVLLFCFKKSPLIHAWGEQTHMKPWRSAHPRANEKDLQSGLLGIGRDW